MPLTPDPITDPVAIRASNENFRPVSESIANAASDAKAILAAWDAQGMADRIPNTDAPLQDGSPGDGRPPMTGADCHLLMEALRAIVETLNTPASNGKPHFINALRVAPNIRRR